MTTSEIEARKQQHAPQTEEAFEIIERILRRADTRILGYAFDIHQTRNIRTLSSHGVRYAHAESVRSMLFYESGWIRSESGKRTFIKLFILPNTKWLVQTYQGASEPTVQTCELHEILPLLREFGFYGFRARRSIRLLLLVMRPRSKWPDCWEELRWQINELY